MSEQLQDKNICTTPFQVHKADSIIHAVQQTCTKTDTAGIHSSVSDSKPYQ